MAETQKINSLTLVSYSPELEPGHGSPGHRVSDYARVGSGLGSKLFTYRPGIVTRLLTEQQNDTAWLTHERIVEVEAVVKVCMKEDLN